MSTTTEITPVAAGGIPVNTNIFDRLAFLVLVARLSLEGKSAGTDLPRYIRILKIKEIDPPEGLVKDVSDGIERAVDIVTEGLVIAVNKMIGITLDAKDILGSTDSLVAQAEVALKLVEQIVDDQFAAKLAQGISLGYVDPPPSFLLIPPSVSNSIKSSIHNIENIFDLIPKPDDLDFLGHELYLLACVLHKNKQEGIEGTKVVDIESSGKVRFLQYGFKKDWSVPPQNSNTADIILKHLGKRALSAQTYATGEVRTEDKHLLYKIDLAAGGKEDENEAKSILKDLGYSVATTDLTLAVKQFQIINEIPMTGKIDNATLNLLFNLDVFEQNLRRAKKFRPVDDHTSKICDFITLINHDAESPRPSEWAKSFRDYNYYVVESTSNEDDLSQSGKGWYSVTAGDYVRGFIGLTSRKLWTINPLSYHGGALSEGQACKGTHFFGARITEPDLPSRGGLPLKPIYPDGTIIHTNKIARMIQIVPIDQEIISNLRAYSQNALTKYNKFKLTARARVRCLYNEKAKSKESGQIVPDQTRVLLQIWSKKEPATAEDTPIVKLVMEDNNSPWFPDTTKMTEEIIQSKCVDYKNFWDHQSSKTLLMDVSEFDTNLKYYAKVILEGRHATGWDIDSYFDEVQLKWKYALES